MDFCEDARHYDILSSKLHWTADEFLEIVETQCLSQSSRDNDHQMVLEFLGRNPDLPVELMERLSEMHYGVLGLLENPNLPATIIRKLSKTKFYTKQIQEKLVIHPNCPIDVNLYLASVGSTLTRSKIAGIPNLPVEIYEILGNDGEEIVLEKLGSNPSTPVHILEKIVNLRLNLASFGVAYNAQSPEYLVKKAIRDLTGLQLYRVTVIHRNMEFELSDFVQYLESPNSEFRETVIQCIKKRGDVLKLILLAKHDDSVLLLRNRLQEINDDPRRYQEDLKELG